MPYSGTFSFEATAIQAGYRPEQIVSNDPSLYSYTIGRFLAGKPYEWEVSQDYDNLMHMSEQVMQAAYMIWAIKHMQLRAKKGVYFQELLSEMEENRATIVEKTAINLNKMHSKLEGISYHSMDGMDFTRRWSTDFGWLILSDPPCYKAGYDKLFGVTKDYVSWPGKEVGHFDTENGVKNLCEMLRESPATPIINMVGRKTPPDSNITGPGWEVVGECHKYGNAGVSSEWMIGRRRDRLQNKVVTVIAKPQRGIDLKLWDKDAIPENVSFHVSKSNVWIGKQIVRNWVSGTPDFEVAAMAEGKIVGVYGWKCDAVNKLHGDKAYLLYAFASPMCRLRGFQKFMLELALCRVMEKTVNYKKGNHVSVATRVSSTCFSKNPMSMPYRGIFSLEKKEEKKGEYRCVYVAHWTGKTARQVCAEYQQRLGAS